MDHLLLLLLLLWSSGAQSEGNHMSTESNMFRLVGGDSRCAGRLDMKHQGDWRPEGEDDWNLKRAAAVCRELDCGSAVSLQWGGRNRDRPEWLRMCIESSSFSSRTGNSLQECERLYDSSSSLNLTCSDSVRLLDGTGLCSGRLEVRSNQQWSSVCDADFDQQDAEVVCRELGCGTTLARQGGLYGEGKAPVGSTKFQCGGHESALLDCKSSDSARTTCSPGKVVGLTCSEPDEFRLVGGGSRCTGRVDLKHQGDWKPVDGSDWNLKKAAVFCRELDCGSAVSVEQREESSERPAWWINSDFVENGSCLRECVESLSDSSYSLDLTCSDSVRLLDGTGLCSGRLEVRSNQQWSSVCDADFDQQDAEVVCRELGCGAPLARQGGLYGEGKAPVGSTKFQCGGHESALLDCKSSDSARTTCSPGKAVGLTCSEPGEIRLVGGDSRCAGRVELKHKGAWRPMDGYDMTLMEAAGVCSELDCGSAVSVEQRKESSEIPVWWINPDCVETFSVVRECVEPFKNSSSSLNLTCSSKLTSNIIRPRRNTDSVRLLDGTGLCSGTLEVRSNQQWSSVCDADFDLQDAEVVCRELGCGTTLARQGGLYGEGKAPVGSTKFQCGGHESALLDCKSSDSARTTCSPGKVVGLTCSEPDEIRLVGGDSRCAGRVELKHQGDWKPVDGHYWTLKKAAGVCRELDCGSAVSVERREESSEIPAWWINSDLVEDGFSLRECVESITYSSYLLNLTCSDLLLQPIIFVSSVDGVSQVRQQGLQVFRGFSFTISCSIQPQYPGGSFQLTFTSSFSNAEHNYTQPAVNHSAHFLFPVAEPAQQGTYTCVYQVYVFSHSFSSESGRLSVSVSDPTVFLLKVIALPLTLLLLSAALYFYSEAIRGQMSNRQEDIELVNSPLGGGAEEEGDVQGVHLTSRGI